MLLMTELIEDVKYVTEDAGDGKKNYFIEGIFMQGDIKNRNGRIYPLSVLKNEVDRYVKENVDKNRAYGELGHPQGPTINLPLVSHMFKSLNIEGSNVVGRAKIITENPMGKIVKNLMDEGASLGVSSRGMGSLELKNGINEVQSDFRLATAGDIVADPSAPEAFVNGIMEGVEWLWEDGRYIQVVEQTKKIIEKLPARQLSEKRMMQIFDNFCKNL